MLILAGVSINAIVGEDGILSKAKRSSFATKIAAYSEEFEMNAVGAITDEGVNNRNKITLMNEYVKQYVPSLTDNDVGQFAIINGQLYYVGDEPLEKEVCKSQGYNTLPEGMTAEEFASSVESSAIEEILKNMTGNAFTSTDDEGNTQTLGVQLWDKTFANGNKWKIITEVENGANKATYGTEWYYVEAGQNVEGIGILKNSYIINYTTRKAVRFDANKHTMLAYGSNLAVTEDWAINVDPTNMSDGSSNSWGSAILHGFSGSEYDDNNQQISGWSKSALHFDGVDDYIEFPNNYVYDSNKGFSMEFYSNFKDMNSDIFVMKHNPNISGFYLIIGISANHQYTQNTEYDFFGKYALWIGSEEIVSSSSPWYCRSAVGYKLANDPVYGDNYVTLTFSPDLTTTIYINGNKYSSEKITTQGYNNLLKDLNDNNKLFSLGRTFGSAKDGSGGSTYVYENAALYSFRSYNKVLTQNEVVANYNATVSYHNILVNNGNASTGGNTGGEDIGTIE